MTYLFQWRQMIFIVGRPGTQAEFLDKGKPVVRPGRKAIGSRLRDRQVAEGNTSEGFELSSSITPAYS